MIKTTLLSILLLTPTVLPAAPAPDPLENLIEKEHQEEQDWADDPIRAELPPAIMIGNTGAVQIFGPGSSTGDKALCNALEIDELIEVSRGQSTDAEVEINTSLPRVREILEDSCLIRPDDEIFAVGRGSQKIVHVEKFIAKRRPVDSLWMTVNPPLDDEPLFYTTLPELAEGSNQYVRVDSFESGPLDETLKQRTLNQVSYLEEFTAIAYKVNDPSLQQLIYLKRRHSAPEDDKLPNEILLAVRGMDVVKIWEEAVNMEKGSGSLSPEGMFDFNQDGILDLELTGSRAGRPYVIFFKGTGRGWTPLEIPDILQ